MCMCVWCSATTQKKMLHRGNWCIACVQLCSIFHQIIRYAFDKVNAIITTKLFLIASKLGYGSTNVQINNSVPKRQM